MVVEVKKPRVTIATHSGRFHSDDVFGVATLCLLLENENEIEIIRTRDMEKIQVADYAVDTGFVYDPESNRFDHHQEGGAGKRENGIPYASFGLVWKKYGPTVCGSSDIADTIEGKLVLPIDARDNGIDIHTNIYPGVSPFEFRDITWAFRTTWKEDVALLYENFLMVVDFAKKILKREIIQERDMSESKLIMRDVFESSDDKRLLILDKPYPWDEFASSNEEILLVVYPKVEDNTWAVQSARNNLKSYESRCPLPLLWAGKNNKELELVSGISGAIFCHNGRFIAGAITKEATIELAKIALRESCK